MRTPDADALVLLNIAREAIDDHTDTEQVSRPGEADPGEFYATFRGENYLVRIEVM